MALINELKRQLAAAFPGAQIKLSVSRPGGRVQGSLIWDGFDAQEQIDRQIRLRDVIDSLPPDDRAKVSFIMTITPQERVALTRP